MADPKDDSVNQARRRLLGMAKYVPPTVLGIIALQQAGCQQTPSCNPVSCNPATSPCNPDTSPCGPNTGCGPDSCGPNGGPCGPDSCPPAN